MKLGDLIAGYARLGESEAAIEISGMGVDSRKMASGFVFFAMPGTRVDGAKFIPQALENGAVAVIAAHSSDIGDLSVPVIKVEEPRIALAHLAARLYPRQPQTMVAVTGTAGKTSVASFIRQIWSHCGQQAASIGTTGVDAPGLQSHASLTTPDPVDLHRLLDELAEAGVNCCSMEASSHGLDQHRLDGVRLAAAGFTNLGRDHMDYHPTVEDYLAAKMRLFRELLPKGAPAVIFADDEFSERVCQVAEAAGNKVLRVGRKGDFLALKRVEHERFKQVAEIHHGDGIYRVVFPLAGDFQIANALVAAGMAIATGSEPGQVMSALEGLKGASGRLELVGSTRQGAPAYVDYAHKPDALENVLAAVRPFTTGRIITVFGCGGDRDPGKRPIMGKIAVSLSDKVIVTDDNPRSEEPAAIRAAILAAAPGAMEIADRREAIFAAVEELQIGDCLIVAGKGHEEGQTVGEKVLPFSDHQVVREALQQKDGKTQADGEA